MVPLCQFMLRPETTKLILPTLLLGLATMAAWKWLGPARHEEGVGEAVRNQPGG